MERGHEELEQARSDLEQIAHAASHDLLEPLRTISAYLQLLDTRYRGRLDADADQCLRFANDGALRLSRMVSDLLGYLRVNTHGGERVPTDGDAALQVALERLQPEVKASGAEIQAATLPRVLADPLQFSNLLQLLLDNAIKFAGTSPPRIRIDARREGAEWIFSVRDEGIGFDMHFAQRIFDLFQQLHPRERYPGTGVGLAVCRKIVARHSGRIWADSAPGAGATFHFTLPAAGAD